MSNKAMPAVLAGILTLGLAGCADNRQENQGGGGGSTTNTTTTTTVRAAQNARDAMPGDATTRSTQVRTTTSDHITDHGERFAEAYARMPWVHANLVAKDWRGALNDLHYVRDHIDEIAKDSTVTGQARTAITTVKGEIKKLDAKIQAHDMTAVQDSKRLLNWFTATIDKPMMTAWFGPMGGGAGTAGEKTHMNP